MLAIVSAVIAGVMNSIAGGGTLLTFPALIALGVPPIMSNATSSVALWPGTMGSMWGYRNQLRGAAPWAVGFAIPSVLGGALGAYLLLRTPEASFSALVPWLVLGATALFMVQRPVMRWLDARRPANSVSAPADETVLASNRPPLGIMVYQFLVAVYGGYFGAGVGILMLAALGFVGFHNIHRMNAVKNVGGISMNLVAVATFSITGLVNWPIALAMAAGAIAGGYIGSRTAQRVPQAFVRGSVVAIGLVSGVLLFLTK